MLLIHVTKSLVPYLKEQMLSEQKTGCDIKKRSQQPIVWSWHGHRFPYGNGHCVLLCHDDSGYVLVLPSLSSHDYEHFSDLIRDYLLGTVEHLGFTPAESKKLLLQIGATMIDDQASNPIKEMLSVAWQDIHNLLEDRPNVLLWNPLKLNELINQRIIKKEGEWCRPDQLFTALIERTLEQIP